MKKTVFIFRSKAKDFNLKKLILKKHNKIFPGNMTLSEISKRLKKGG
jgi:predicted transcriptional regulator with HTH domain